MHKSWSRWFRVGVVLRYMSAFYVAALLCAYPALAAAQTATNAVDDMVANIGYARTNVVPLALTALGLFIGIAAAVKYWKRIFGKA